MHSEVIALKDGFLSFNQQTLPCLRPARRTMGVGSRQPLSSMEASLLIYFCTHSGRTLSREELAEQVWKQRYFHGSRTIDQTVSKLRKKLRRDAKILSVWSAGYRFEGESGFQDQTKEFARR